MIESIISAGYHAQNKQLREFALKMNLISVNKMAMLDTDEIMKIINTKYIAFYVKTEGGDIDYEVIYLLPRDVVDTNVTVVVR